ncbi:MFS transporter permease [Microbacterium sp. NPDC056234]|uniref:MFS transporter permease n=1 Tax=Microbacterium sp. NPDC056234 TaxID=3345757 RepID=UPI0035D6B312
MWLREAFFRWLIPAAFVLPLWLLIGWGVFSGGGWAFLFLFVGIPSVFVGQLILTLLVRARPSVRISRAVSWWDVAGFGLWHALTIAVGFYPSWFAPALTVAIIAGIGLIWSSLWQLWREAGTAGGIRVVTTSWQKRGVDEPTDPQTGDSGVFVIREKPDSER